MGEKLLFFIPNWLQLIALLFLLLCIQHSSGFVNEADLFPYDESSGSALVNPSNFHQKIQLSNSFNFLTTPYSLVLIARNRVIFFDAGSGPTCDFSRSSIPEVGTRLLPPIPIYFKNPGNMLYKQDRTGAALDKVSKDVYKAFPEMEHVRLDWMMVVTWHNVSHSDHGDHFTFQTILTTDGSHSFVLFYYNKIKGASAADTNQLDVSTKSFNRSQVNSGSCDDAGINRIGEMSNIDDDEPGKFVFRVDTKFQPPSRFSSD